MQGERLRIGAGRQVANDPERLRVDHLDGVVVAGADQNVFPILGQGDPARPLADRDRFHGLHRVQIDDADRVVALICDECRVREGWKREQEG